MTDAGPIGIIGLGLMGSAMAGRLIEAGLTPVGFDIDTAKGDALKAQGGEIASSVRALASRCRIIVIAVYSAAQVEAVLGELADGAPSPPPAVLCTTTCGPDEISSIGQRAADFGLSFVEAPISGTSAELRDGTASALVAGDAGAIQSVSALLKILCPRRVYVGEIGNAGRTKLAINLILQNNRAALAEGIAFAECLGLDGRAFLAAAKQSAAYSSVMDSKGEKMLARDFRPQSHIAQTLKDAELILAEAERHALRLPITLAQSELLRAAILLEGPDSDSAAVIEAIRPRSTAGARK
jgi:L-threonate 2-dehydrogenase